MTSYHPQYDSNTLPADCQLYYSGQTDGKWQIRIENNAIQPRCAGAELGNNNS